MPDSLGNLDAPDNTTDPATFAASGTPSLQQLVDYFVETLTAPQALKRIETMASNAAARGGATLDAVTSATLTPIVKFSAVPLAHLIAETLLTFLKTLEPVTSDISKLALDSVLGAGTGRAGVPADIGRVVLEKLAPPSDAIEPGTLGAEQYLTTMLNLNMETWLLGFLAEAFADSLDMFRGAGLTLKSVGELREIVTQVFGGGRVTRRVLAPFIDDGIVTPAKWATQKRYRPKLLNESQAVRQQLRGRWTVEQRDEELARQGYSADRIDALANEARKFFSPSEVREFQYREHWDGVTALQHLLDQGYDKPTAEDALRLEGIKIIAAHENALAADAVAAYARRDIDRPTFLAFLDGAVSIAAERALHVEIGETRRRFNTKRLTAAQTEACVKAGVLAVADYRDALRFEGYDEASVLSLELLLRHTIAAKDSIDNHRAQALADRAAEKTTRDAARAAAQQRVEAAQALKRRGPLSALERAVATGLIPIARLEEVLVAEFDPDTVNILIGLVEEQRQAYLDQQAKADAARQRAAHKGLDVAQLEAAVYADTLDLPAFRQRLVFQAFDPADVEVLVATVTARKKDLDAAKAQRSSALDAAGKKHIDLARLEHLVRRGARTLDDYTALLTQLGYDDAARAGMVDLLQLEITQDQKAAQLRADAEAKLSAKGLSLEQFRRAVVLGLKTENDYTTFLVNQKFTADAVATLAAEAQIAVTEAEAARQRRAQADAVKGAHALSLATVARAARLGLVSPDAYQQRLVAAGYTPDDIAIDLELLVTEIADTQAARARRDALAAKGAGREPALTTIATAVKAGVASVEDYRARAVALGYAPEDVTLLVALLQAEVGAAADAKARHDAIAAEQATKDVTLATLEQGVTGGLMTLDAFVIELESRGYEPADVELVASLLAAKLGVPPPAPGA